MTNLKVFYFLIKKQCIERYSRYPYELKNIAITMCFLKTAAMDGLSECAGGLFPCFGQGILRLAAKYRALWIR
jgi:hypothetical protein